MGGSSSRCYCRNEDRCCPVLGSSDCIWVISCFCVFGKNVPGILRRLPFPANVCQFQAIDPLKIVRQLVSNGGKDTRQRVVSAPGRQKLGIIPGGNADIGLDCVFRRLEEAAADAVAVSGPDAPGALDVDRDPEGKVVL